MQCALVLQTMVSNTGKENDFLPVQIERKEPWRKVLYEDQGVPDNYVDKSFLEEMKKNCEYNITCMEKYLRIIRKI